MKGAHLTLAIFCHLLLASLAVYFSSLPAVASPFDGVQQQQQHQQQRQQQQPAPNVALKSDPEPAAVQQVVPVAVEPPKPAPVDSKEVQQKSAPVGEPKPVAAPEPKAPSGQPKKLDSPQESRSSAAEQKSESVLTKKDSDTAQPSHPVERKESAASKFQGATLSKDWFFQMRQAEMRNLEAQRKAAVHNAEDSLKASEPTVSKYAQEEAPVKAETRQAVAEASPVQAPVAIPVQVIVNAALAPASVPAPVPAPAPASVPAPVPAPAPASVPVPAPVPVPVPVSAPAPAPARAPAPAPALASTPVQADKPKKLQVMGGLGPLHLLATTLCRYKPEKRDSPVQDDSLNQLYARRLAVRRQLFDFMSLKFTNLEKLSSRLGHGLQVAPAASAAVAPAPGAESKSSPALSHGWPVVGKCTAYDLRLMGEAAYCDNSSRVEAPEAPLPQVPQVQAKLPIPPSEIHSIRVRSVDSIEATSAFLAEQQAAAAPTPSPKELSATLECRRNALRYSKALFNHLAEDQGQVSESWPELYAALSSDDCARRRAIDIFTALSGFRTEVTSIRRDNLEFAFAMDDLRAKVLENDVSTPLSFDKNFIEVEQFLQQSVRLMLANIQPKRAAITSARYRSLMYDASPNSDEQCIDLHQRLLARNYPSDCDPTQFGQLPDVLRMTASSLELWSIEKELSQRFGDQSSATSSDVNECVANLVSS